MVGYSDRADVPRRTIRATKWACGIESGTWPYHTKKTADVARPADAPCPSRSACSHSGKRMATSAVIEEPNPSGVYRFGVFSASLANHPPSASPANLKGTFSFTAIENNPKPTCLLALASYLLFRRKRLSPARMLLSSRKTGSHPWRIRSLNRAVDAVRSRIGQLVFRFANGQGPAW